MAALEGNYAYAIPVRRGHYVFRSEPFPEPVKQAPRPDYAPPAWIGSDEHALIAQTMYTSALAQLGTLLEEAMFCAGRLDAANCDFAAISNFASDIATRLESRREVLWQERSVPRAGSDFIERGWPWVTIVSM